MTKKFFRFPTRFLPALLILLIAAAFTVHAQKTDAPRQEKILNGLRVLIWNAPGAEKATVKLRIHSGAAFDRQGREGTMALLADILFPNEEFRSFFEEDMNGKLEIESNFDYLQITASGDSDKLLTILETVAQAVSNPEITKETTAKVRNARIEKIRNLEKDQIYIADKAARGHLLGEFPYGRALGGTVESLAGVDYAEVLFARQRFLSPDNATLAIVGDVKPDFAMRAVRRYFGSWIKGDEKIPATFTQPEAPPDVTLQIQTEHGENSQIRYAMRGLARNDADFHASQILLKILEERMKKVPSTHTQDLFIRQDATFLPGVIFFGYTSVPVPVVAEPVNPTPGKKENIVTLIMRGDATSDEFTRAKNAYLSEMNNYDLVERWLDADTYKLTSQKTDADRSGKVTLTDINRVLARLREQPTVFVSVMKKPLESEKDNEDNTDETPNNQ